MKSAQVRGSHDFLHVAQPERTFRTTKDLALAALNTDKPLKPYVGIERQVAKAIGSVLLAMIDAGMPNHYERSTPNTRFSVLSDQMVRAYDQLRFGTGVVEEFFRILFHKQFGRNPVDVTDIRGDEKHRRKRLHDAEGLIRIVRKFSPWPEVADDLARYIFDEDRQISAKFLKFYSTVLRPQMAGRVLSAGLHPKTPMKTNKALLWFKQDGTVVRLAFGPRWGLRRGTIEFVGEIGDRTGETFKIVESSLPVCKALAALESFNWTREGISVELDARKRALGIHGFGFAKNPKSKLPVLVNNAPPLA